MSIRRGMRITRRSAFLLLFGALFVLIGYSYFGPVTPPARRALRLALEVAPLWVYGLGWSASGVLAIFGGLVRRWDWLGFAAAVSMPGLWAIVYATAWIVGDAPRGWVTATLFLLISSAIMVVSGMQDPAELLPPEGKR